MWLKAQNEMAGFLPHAAMGPVERMVRFHRATFALEESIVDVACQVLTCTMVAAGF